MSIISASFSFSIKSCTRALHFGFKEIQIGSCLSLSPLPSTLLIFAVLGTLQRPCDWSLSLFLGALIPAWPLRTQRLWEKPAFVFSRGFAEVLISSFAKSYNQTVRGLWIFPPSPPPSFWLLAPIISMVLKTHLVLWRITQL